MERQSRKTAEQGWLFWVILSVSIASMAYGTYLGNVFETYHSGSTL